MRLDLGMKSTRKPPEKRGEPFSLTSTLDQYEVEELDARAIAHLLAERRRREGRAVTTDSIWPHEIR